MIVQRHNCAVYNVGGADRLDLLQRLTTNNISLLQPGGGMATVLATAKGRILDLLFVYCFEDHLLMLGAQAMAQQVVAHFNKYTITEDFTITDVTNAFDVFAIFGDHPTAKNLSALETLRSAKIFSHVEQQIENHRCIFSKGIFVKGSGFTLLVEKNAGEEFSVEECLDEKVSSPATLELMQVREGLPAWGSELNEKYNPLEVGAESAVSFTKGCYLGQEIIARLNSQKKVQRTLMGISIQQKISGALPFQINCDGIEAGELTSVVEDANGMIGLCVVRKEFAEAGKIVSIEIEAGTVEGELKNIVR